MKQASFEKLRRFLKEMFQFAENDLDFGVFRILNLKRAPTRFQVDSYILLRGSSPLGKEWKLNPRHRTVMREKLIPITFSAWTGIGKTKSGRQ